MADNKKYYYLKLKDNFFESSEIKVLESMQNGYKYSNLLLKLYLKALKFNGSLRLNEYIPYNTEMISAVTGMDVDTVKVAFDLFTKLKLIEIMDDGTIYMLDIQNFIGTSSTEADRKRRYRLEIEEKSKGQGQMSGQISDKNPPEIELEKERELEIRDRDISSSSTEEEEEEDKDLKEIMKMCQLFSYKLKKKDAKILIDTFGSHTVKKGLGIATTTTAFKNNEIKGYSQYLATILKDLSTEQRKVIEINNAKKNSFTNYKQREYDYEKLEKELCGFDNEVK